jgi:hypothetical protein
MELRVGCFGSFRPDDDEQVERSRSAVQCGRRKILGKKVT